MKTLELYNAVKARKGGEYKILPKYGVIVEPSASYALADIENFCEKRLLTGDQLNATFHKSWEKVISSTREELLVHQILHYLTTYGTNHQSTFIYTPNEELEVPDVNVNFLVIRGLTEDEMIEKSFDLLNSGVAMKQETISDVLSVLLDCGYSFTGEENVKNKEALMLLYREAGEVPKDPVEFVRYLVYLSTDNTLLIKNRETLDAIKEKRNEFAVRNALAKADLEAVSSVFNRFKPILLAFKSYGESAKKAINKISKLSKTNHKPIAYNILNDIGKCTLKELRSRESDLMNANFFQLARCLNYLKLGSKSTAKVYQIRNGKFYSKPYNSKIVQGESKILFILDLMKKKFDFDGLKVYIPSDVFYALPTSEKNFVGNIPTGTKLVSDSAIAAGIYWENSGGASDLDLSSISVTGGKVGWNSTYNNDDVTYSGDITSAPKGATEYMRFKEGMSESHLIMNNVYSGAVKGSEFRIVFGKGSNIDKKYMMDPNKVWFTAPTETLQKQSVVGFVTPDPEHGTAAIVVNAGFGSSQVSGGSGKNSCLATALTEKWANAFYLNDVLEHCGAEIVDDSQECDVDLTPSKLEKDSIIGLFKEE